MAVTDLGRPRVRAVKKSDKARRDQKYLKVLVRAGRAGLDYDAPDRKISPNLTEMIIITALTPSFWERERERER